MGRLSILSISDALNLKGYFFYVIVISEESCKIYKFSQANLGLTRNPFPVRRSEIFPPWLSKGRVDHNRAYLQYCTSHLNSEREHLEKKTWYNYQNTGGGLNRPAFSILTVLLLLLRVGLHGRNMLRFFQKTDRQTDRRNKYLLGLPCFQKLSSEYPCKKRAMTNFKKIFLSVQCTTTKLDILRGDNGI